MRRAASIWTGLAFGAVLLWGCGGGDDPAPAVPGEVAPLPEVDPAPVAAPSAQIIAVRDDVLPVIGDIANGGLTNDTTPTLSGSLDRPLAAAQSLQVLRNGELVGIARVLATNWSFTDSPLDEGEYVYSARVVDVQSLPGLPGNPYTIRIAKARYTLQVLPIPSNYYTTRVTSINQPGAVTASFNERSLNSGYLVTEDVAYLLASNFPQCYPAAINDQGLIAGTAAEDFSIFRATLWTSYDRARDLGVLVSGEYSLGYGVNDSGLVVGSSDSAEGPRAFIWQEIAGMRSLGTLTGDTASSAVAINDRAVVVGTSTSSAGSVRAFRWTSDAGLEELTGLPAGSNSHAVSINDTGEIVGAFGSAGAPMGQPFVWRESGVQELPMLLGTDQCEPVKIDAYGTVFGRCTISQPSQYPNYSRATVWLNGVPHDLASQIEETDPLRSFVKVVGASGSDASGRIAVDLNLIDPDGVFPSMVGLLVPVPH